MAPLASIFGRDVGMTPSRGSSESMSSLEQLALLKAQRSPSRVNPRAQLEIGAALSSGRWSDGTPLTRAGVLELLAELGIVGRNLIPLRSDNDTLAASVAISIQGQYIEGMGVVCISKSTGVAVGAVPVYSRVHRATWNMDNTPLFDSQAQPFFAGESFSDISFFRLPRGGQLLTGTATASFPVADVGQLDTYIYEDADAAERLFELLVS